MLTQEKLKELLHYDPEIGLFIRKVKLINSMKIGDVAGHKTDRDYVRIMVSGQRYQAHRLAWFYVHGVWPKDQLDHINHDKADNRIENLRSVTGQENSKNQPIAKNNKSGIIGVYWDKQINKWTAKITANKEKIYLGVFVDLFEACCVRKSAENKYRFHENHGAVL